MEFPGWRDGCRPGCGGGVAAVVEDKGWRPFHDVTC